MLAPSTFNFEGMRYYYSEKEKLWYPSVTSVLSHSKKDFFEQWAKDPKNAEESKRSLNRGTKLHYICERHLLNQPLEHFKEEMPSEYYLYLQLRPYLNKIQPIAIETTLLSDYLQVAGRSDCIGLYDGSLSIVDFKGSKKTKQEKWIEDYFLQATAYAIMYEEMNPGQIVKEVVILIANEEGGVQEFRRSPINYCEKLNERLKNYRNSVDFESLQRYISSAYNTFKGDNNG